MAKKEKTQQKEISKDFLNKMPSCDIKQLLLSAYLNKEMKEYALYVLETRALPNIMDGLRIGARKILWAAMTGDLSKKSGSQKLNSLSGDALKLNYHHGDVSLINTIVSISSDHIMKYKPLEIVGQIPTLRVTDCDTAARYLSIRKTQHLKLFQYDSDILDILVEEGENVQPRHFLPIIPIVLLYRTSMPGIGIGYSCNSYKLSSIIDNCIYSLLHGKCNDSKEISLIPEIDSIAEKNIIWNDMIETYFNIGEYKLSIETDTITITDLPYDVTFDKFEQTLTKLQNDKYILEYKNLSIRDEINFQIKFEKGRLRTLANDKWNFFKKLRLFSKIKNNNLNCIDFDGKRVLQFENAYHLIDSFVEKRLSFYTKRKENSISDLEAKKHKLSEQMKFIKLVVAGEIIVTKRNLIDLKKDLDFFDIDYCVLDIPIYRLTNEEISKLENEIQKCNCSINEISKTSTKNMYLNDLIQLREKYYGIVSK